MKSVFSLSRVLLVLVCISILSIGLAIADVGSLDWLNHYHGADDEHSEVSGCLDSQNNLIVSFGIYDSDHVNSSWRVQKYNSAGSMIWDRELRAGSNTDGGTSVTTDYEGNIYVASAFYVQGHSTLSRVAKLDPAGNEIWNVVPDSSMGQIADIHYRDDGYLLIVGYNRSGIQVNCHYAADDMNCTALWTAEIEQIDDYNVFQIKYSELDADNRITVACRLDNGTYSGVGWVRLLENGIQDVSGSYFIDDTNVFFEGAAALDPSGKLYCFASISNGERNCNILGINVDGSLVWTSTVGNILFDSANGGSLILDQGNPVIAALNTDHTVQCASFAASNGVELWNTNTTTTLRDCYPSTLAKGDGGEYFLSGCNIPADETHAVIKFTEEGEEWAFFFGEPEITSATSGHPGFTQYINGGLIAASAIGASYTNLFGVDTFRIESVTSSAPETGGDQLPNDFKVDTYPNPFNATVNIKLNLPVSGDVNIRLVDMLGRTVYDAKENIGNGSHILSVNAEDLTSGLYLLEAKDSKGNRVTKRLTLLK